MARSYSFSILLVSLLFVTISLSALNTQTPLWLNDAHFPIWQQGIVGSSYFIGNLAGTLLANWLICKVNVKKTYTLTCFLFAIATLGMGFSIGIFSWSFWRFLIGIACAITWVVVESCILVTSKSKNRGRMVAIYMTSYYLGTVLGQWLLRYFPDKVVYFALVINFLMALATVFILLTHYRLPAKKHRVFNVMSMIKYQPARSGLVGCIISGMIIGGIYSLLPTYYEQLGFPRSQVANWMIIIIASGLVAQMPIGYLVDKYGTRIVLILESVVLIIACLLIINHDYAIIGTILIGATAYTIYPLSMAWACGLVDKQNIVLMNQTMLLVNTVGCLLAPVIISVLMGVWGNDFLFICFIFIAIYFIGFLFYKKPQIAS